MGIWSKFNLWLLKSDVKDLKKGNTGDKIQALYERCEIFANHTRISLTTMKILFIAII